MVMTMVMVLSVDGIGSGTSINSLVMLILCPCLQAHKNTVYSKYINDNINSKFSWWNLLYVIFTIICNVYGATAYDVNSCKCIRT